MVAQIEGSIRPRSTGSAAATATSAATRGTPCRQQRGRRGAGRVSGGAGGAKRVGVAQVRLAGCPAAARVATLRLEGRPSNLMTSPSPRAGAPSKSTGRPKVATAKPTGKPKVAKTMPPGRSRVSKPEATLHSGRVIDAFSDAEGIWTTVPMPAMAFAPNVPESSVAGSSSGPESAVPAVQPAVRKSIPSGSGWHAGEAWAVHVDATLPQRLGLLLDGEQVTTRMAALAAFVANVAELIASGNFVPTADQQGRRWLPTPEPVQAVALAGAGQDLVDAGFFRDESDPAAALERLVSDLLNSIAPTRAVPGGTVPLAGTPHPSKPSAAARRWQRWAKHVATRRASNARLVLRLDVPADLVVAAEPAAGAVDEEPETIDRGRATEAELVVPPTESGASGAAPSQWTLTPIAVALDDPTTRFPVSSSHELAWPLPATPAGVDEATAATGHRSAAEGARAAAAAVATHRSAAAAPGPNRASRAFRTPFEAWAKAELAALRRAWPKGPFTSLQPTQLSSEEALDLLDHRIDVLAELGIEVIMPSGLLRPTSVRRKASAERGLGLLGAGDLQLRAEFTVNGAELTDAEVEALVHAKSELVSVRGHWIRVDDSERAALSRLLQLAAGPISLTQLLAGDALDGVEWQSSPLQQLQAAAPTEPSPLVNATLRHYQLAGLDWLTWVESNRTGGILADDMGLGKTLQVLARIAADHVGPTLVVCPVTLVDTWLRQAAQFTPELRIRAHHGSERRDSEIAEGADIVVTSYGVLARDEVVRATPWHRVVLDEAQAVKNPDTRVARAARALTATHRLAVTGTPVENHVGDLWSLMAFAMPGLLPARATFRRRFGQAAPDSAELQLLRDVTAPFVLRRLKSDPAILPDLPERVVVRDDCALTKEQVGAYEAVARQLLETLDGEGAQPSGRPGARGAKGAQPGGAAGAAPGIARRATVLAAIGRLKQVCVHPALLTENRRGLRGRSGKVDRLTDLCAEIIDEGQAVVVFTQFASFVPDLAAHLQEHLGTEIATLVGSHSRTRRAATVDAFAEPDGPPVLVASIKAGGTGLTLTRANHVVHLDRWWNPAVEDQASDRVWRIGQQRNVVVHTLVCPGTLEERIDAMLTAKRGIADAVVRSTDTAVTELSTAELADLVTLSRDRTLQ